MPSVAKGVGLLGRRRGKHMGAGGSPDLTGGRAERGGCGVNVSCLRVSGRLLCYLHLFSQENRKRGLL